MICMDFMSTLYRVPFETYSTPLRGIAPGPYYKGRARLRYSNRAVILVEQSFASPPIYYLYSWQVNQ